MNYWKVFLTISFGILFLTLSTIFVSASTVTSHKFETKSVELEGRLSIIWGDSISEVDQKTATRYFLIDNSGNKFELRFDDEAFDIGNILGFQDQLILVSGQQQMRMENVEIWVELISSNSMTSLNVPQVMGSQPWISIMCKFSDVADEPENLTFFQGMYADTYPGLNHYWQEQSYGLVDLYGSGASGWYVLPHSEIYYNPSETQGGADLGKLATDCIGVADPYINFAPYAGINLMFNTNFDYGYAWGGYDYFTIDGVFKKWRLTWEPPWGYRNISVIAHETGHGFGLPHSTYNPAQVYDNYWDVMSYTWDNNLSDPTYGNIGQHTISFHKDILDWISPGEKFIPSINSRTTVTLERLAQPQTSNYKMVQIPIDGSSTHFYTVEARRLVGYDAALPGDAVIIHEVNSNWGEPAHVIDIDGDGDTSDGGARWLVGETFSDPANQITVSVDSATNSGYVVTVQLGNPAPKPGDFSKLSPENGSSAQSINPTLSWDDSSGASSYEYCYDISNDNSCSNWVSAGTSNSATLSGLTEGTTYYWQVRAINSGGTTFANGNEAAFWSFTTLLSPPNVFDKLSPINGANGILTNQELSWQSSPNAIRYEYCFDTIDDNDCSQWNSADSETSVWLIGLKTNTTYYWQVRALNTQGVTYANSSPGAYWSFVTTDIIYEIFLPLLQR